MSPGPGRSVRETAEDSRQTHKRQTSSSGSNVRDSATGGGELGPCRGATRVLPLGEGETGPIEPHSKRSAGRSDATTAERRRGAPGVSVDTKTPGESPAGPARANYTIMAKLDPWEGVKKEK